MAAMLTLHQPSQPTPHKMTEETSVIRMRPDRAGARRHTRQSPTNHRRRCDEVGQRRAWTARGSTRRSTAAAQGHVDRPPGVLGDRSGRPRSKPTSFSTSLRTRMNDRACRRPLAEACAAAGSGLRASPVGPSRPGSGRGAQRDPDGTAPRPGRCAEPRTPPPRRWRSGSPARPTV